MTTMRGLLRRMEEATAVRYADRSLSEASTYAKGSWMKYERQAEEEFLKDAIPGIKKIAGNKGDVKMDTSGAMAMLVYEGEDASDFELDFTAYIGVGERTISIGATVKSAQVEGQKLPLKTMPKGEATPQVIVDMFKDVFGRH